MDDPPLVITLVGISALLCGAYAALFSGVSRISEPQLGALSDQDEKWAKTASALQQHGAKIRSRLLTGTISFACLSFYLANQLPSSEWLWSLVSLLVCLLSAIVLTSLLLSRRPRTILSVLRLTRPMDLLFAPFVVPFLFLGGLSARLLPKATEDKNLATLTVGQIIEKGEQKGTISEDQAEMMMSLMEFRKTIVREVMIPRTDVVAFQINTAIKSTLETIERCGHSRYPVYDQNIDSVKGVLYAKDCFLRVSKGESKATLSAVVRSPVFFTTENQKIGGLLREMQSRRVHLAVVVDQFGGTAGIVTLEDIVEEIVGEIHDEHDNTRPQIITRSPGTHIADAKMSIYDFSDRTDMALIEGTEEFDFDSLGGLVVHIAGRVPKIGESVDHGSYRIRVVDSDERRVARVQVRKIEEEPEQKAASDSSAASKG